jgi:hypothetical protein
MSILAINWLAVIVAALAAFAVGAVWYGPLFSRAWQQLNALSDEAVQQDAARTFGGAFVLTLVAAFGLAMILQLHPAPDLGAGLSVGVVIGLAFVASSLGINYLFARKALRLYLIDAGYLVLMFAVMGVILGAWR